MDKSSGWDGGRGGKWALLVWDRLKGWRRRIDRGSASGGSWVGERNGYKGEGG